MDAVKSRAAVAALRGDRLLAIRREKRGRRYAVLPGGGVEPDESSQEAALRELREETGLDGVVLRHLWTLEHHDRLADYFLVTVAAAPMKISGPEAQRQSSDNSYQPCWIQVAELDLEDLQPDMVRPLVRQLANRPGADPKQHADRPSSETTRGVGGPSSVSARRAPSEILAVDLDRL